MKLDHKTFVVTGGGNGVGRELVLSLLARHACVAAVDINAEALKETEQLAKEYTGCLSTYEVDITNRSAVERLPEQILSNHQVIDGIINNAGIVHPFLSVEESDYETIRRVFEINFFGTLHITKTFLPYLAAQPEAYIVNVSSFGALSPVPGETIYGASKAAVKMLSEGLLMELDKTSIKILSVLPGGINSDIISNSNADSNMEVGRLRSKFAFLLLSPKRAADIIIRGIEKNRKRIVLGVDARLVNCFSRLSPGLFAKILYQTIDKVLQS